ncbi:PQQ-binding-like beta-propeller repeat protein [Heyndrickxia sp. NPDC080065]|uniref:outer membrane protein assembly factor BamB family protein n=1 Tax=Heyndrickxia sp. NPDC080065 TaxID=3390568 RepID=UPI003D0656D7
MRRFLKATGSVLLASIVIVGCQTKNNQKETKVTNKANQVKETGFPNWGYDLQHTRHVPYKEITKDNVKKMGIVWQQDILDWNKDVPNLQEDFPVVQDGVMYVTSAKNHVFAIDGASGKKLWAWTPPKNVLDHLNSLPWQSNVASRGVAVANGNVYVLMIDNRLAKLDAKTGKLIKMVNFWDHEPSIKLENRYYESSAPMYYDGNIYVGSSGGDNGTRGFVWAFKADTLEPLWKEPFWTVPAEGEGWRKNSKYTGGGSVWTPMSFDPDTDMMYFAVGNPAPDFYDEDRKGKNPYTDSIVALDSKTGKFKWASSQVDHDVWDYDAAATPMVLNAKVGGKVRKIVVEGGKNGKWYAWDAKTGKTIYDGVPFVKIKNSKPPSDENKVVLQWPGTPGGESYAPETYDPETNYVLIPGINSPNLMLAAKDRKEIAKDNNTFPGTKILPLPANVHPSGNITAIDINTGKKVYQINTDDPMYGGFTSTASGLAFYGELDGKVNALDIKKGKVLWSMQSGGKQIKMAPSIYTVGGKQYVAVITGGTRVVVYGLGGKEKVAAPNENAQLQGEADKIPASVDPVQVYKKSCVSCHGDNLQGATAPNLQHIGKTMTKEDILNKILNGGDRMPAGVAKGADAEALAEWLSKKK